MEEAGETMETAKVNPSLAKYAQAWGQPHDLGVVAWTESDQRPAGAAWLRLFQGEQRGYGYVNDETPELAIATLPDHRGRGLGTLLMTHLLAEARQMDFDTEEVVDLVRRRGRALRPRPEEGKHP